MPHIRCILPQSRGYDTKVMIPVGAVSNRATLAQLETAPTKQFTRFTERYIGCKSTFSDLNPTQRADTTSISDKGLIDRSSRLGRSLSDYCPSTSVHEPVLDVPPLQTVRLLLNQGGIK